MKIPKFILNSSTFSSSSPTPPEEHQGFLAFDNLVSMRHELSNICPPKIHIVNDLDDSLNEKEDNVLFNPIVMDDIYLAIVKCPICKFDIEVYSHHGHSEDFETYHMICPVCDEKFGEDEIRTVHNSSYPILRKIWNQQKDGISNVGWKMDHVYGQKSNDFISDEEDTITNASDITYAKVISNEKSSEVDEPDISDEQNIQERSNKAAFSQELLMSAIFLE